MTLMNTWTIALEEFDTEASVGKEPLDLLGRFPLIDMGRMRDLLLGIASHTLAGFQEWLIVRLQITIDSSPRLNPLARTG